MEALSLDQQINLKISGHIQKENIINSCAEKLNSDKNIDSSNKKDFFDKCIEAKVNIYNYINKNNL